MARSIRAYQLSDFYNFYRKDLCPLTSQEDQRRNVRHDIWPVKKSAVSLNPEHSNKHTPLYTLQSSEREFCGV